MPDRGQVCEYQCCGVVLTGVQIISESLFQSSDRRYLYLAVFNTYSSLFT